MWYEEPDPDYEYDSWQDDVYDWYDDHAEYLDYPYSRFQKIRRFFYLKLWWIIHRIKLKVNKHYRETWDEIPF